MIAEILGGIGLFLLGMVLMTDGLKRLAGDALRRLLARFTGGRLSSVATGAAVTALIQSSSATTLTTIGFVSAGLLTFTQAVGVICGANIGTTSTSWIVSTLGLKLDVAVVALPLVGVGVLAELLAKGRLAALGRALAGFGLVFVGIATLQSGMQEASGWLAGAELPTAGIGGRLLLVLVGMVMTVVMQSSSAATATTLTALSTGSIDLVAAAALVIGQNVGTTVTAGVAAIGATVAAKRTALAHVLFNVGTGAIAFAILPLFVGLVDGLAERFGVGDDAISLAAFHTAFNLLGVLLVLPVMGRFSALIERIIPERGSPLVRHLDRSVASVPGVALEVALRSAREIAAATLRAAAEACDPQRPAPAAPQREELRHAHQQLHAFLASLRAEPESLEGYGTHVAVLKLLDHSEQLLAMLDGGRSFAGPADSELGVYGTTVAASLRRLAAEIEADSDSAVPSATSSYELIEKQQHRLRRSTLDQAAAGSIAPDAALRHLDDLRWLRRAAFHGARVAHHAREEGSAGEAED
ncbi:MAG: Na/Pi symporter [Enhygromyxa sp.]